MGGQTWLRLTKGCDIMETNEYKEVYFHQYCKTCEHRDVDAIADPCNECLGNPVNVYSHKPVCYKAKDEKA